MHTQSSPCAQLETKCGRGAEGDEEEEEERKKRKRSGVEACLNDSVIWEEGLRNDQG